MGDEDKPRVDALQKQGWIKQFVASESRLSEAVELYKELGFEVHLEPLPKGQECDTCTGLEKEEPGECRVCFEGSEDQYKIIFTRSAKNRKSSV
jgi:hypothetical protein